MKWEKLYSMQQQLDSYIEKKHQLEDRDLFEEKYLALLVELGELANETRCFKFWSNKERSEKEVILAEFVDGIHFILSLGLEKGYRYNGELLVSDNRSETEQFNQIFIQAALFKQDSSLENYISLFQEYLKLGILLGYSEEDMQQAYFKKNEINYERQNEGY